MENPRIIKFLNILIMGIAIAFPFFVFAYEPATTHKGLTQEIIKVFSAYYPILKLDQAETNAIEKGSVDEDDSARALHHFYDPVYNRGVLGFSTSKDWANNTFDQAILDLAYTNGSALAAVNHRLFDSGTDYSWERAVYDYVWVSKSRGLEGLGHIIHLIEDASVPDHTRNDPHPPYADDIFHQASPYEHWSGKWTTATIFVADKILNTRELPADCETLNSCFDSLAIYSNNNFFSKDTIFDSDYNKPLIYKEKTEQLSNGLHYLFGYGNSPDKIEYRLVKIEHQFGSPTNYYSIEDYDSRIFNDYWSHLSKQAVLHGVSVVKLFFEDVEKERQTKILFGKNKSFMDNMASAVNNFIGVSQPEPQALVSEIPINAFTLVLPPILASVSMPALAAPPEATPPADAPHPAANNTNDVQVISPEFPVQISNSIQSPASLPSPGFGGGSVNTSLAITESVIAPAAPSIISEPNASPATSTPLSETTSLPKDTTPPNISFNINECADSLSPDGCILNKAAISLVWASSASDLNHFIIDCAVNNNPCGGFDFASTTATTTIYTLSSDGSVYIFKAKAVDNLGNISEEISKTVELVSRPVVINEIAWAGSAASSADEWIELYNRSSKTINLNGWSLYAEDGTPYINLSGQITAGGYYLIERTDDSAVNDVSADLIAPFSGSQAGSGLNNSGEILILNHASTTIDKTILCQNRWCGGFAGNDYPSMERIDPDGLGADPSNWVTANGLVKNGADAGGQILNATPRQRNSAHYLISQTNYLPENKILKKSFGAYIVQPNINLEIKTGKTLTIEPGVTVKMGSGSSMLISGTLKSDGTVAENIIFTGLSGSQNPGLWRNIKLTSASQDSSVNYTHFSSGGNYSDLTPSNDRAMLAIGGANVPVSNSVFEYSRIAGLRISSSDSIISGNVFSVGTGGENVGLYIIGGSPTVSGNTFSRNYGGLVIENASAKVSDNIFNDNTSYAISSTNSYSIFSANSGARNGKDGILLMGNISAPAGTTTLAANPLPYLSGKYPYSNSWIAANSVLVLENDVKFLGDGADSVIVVNGTMKLEGENKDGIVFTSLANSAAGQWGGILVNTGGYVYGRGFTLKNGGSLVTCPVCAGFRVLGGSVDLSDGRIENNYNAGMKIYNSATSSLTSFEFNNHTLPDKDSVGLVSANSNLILNKIIYSNNFIDVSN